MPAISSMMSLGSSLLRSQAAEYADLDFDHVKSTYILGGVVELQAAQIDGRTAGERHDGRPRRGGSFLTDVGAFLVPRDCVAVDGGKAWAGHHAVAPNSLLAGRVW